jgi:dolichol-phosphate mannosyltransferase
MLEGQDPMLHEQPALIYSVGALLLGGQLLSIGFLAELITAFGGRDADTYSIAESTSGPDSPPSHTTPLPLASHERAR